METKEIKISSLPFAREMTEDDIFIINQEGTTKIAKASSLRTVKGVKGDPGEPGPVGPAGPQGPVGPAPDLSSYIRDDNETFVAMKDKLDGIDYEANYYIHPDDAITRHVTDVQIKRWDTVLNKADQSEHESLKTLVENLSSKISVLEAQNKVITSTTDPGASAKTSDIWLDLTNNVFKVKLSSGAWQMIGAAYN